MTTHTGRDGLASLRRRTPDGDSGAGTVEYLGAIMIVLAVIGAFVMTATPIGSTIAARLCEAVGASCGSPEDITADEPKGPPDRACTVQTDETNINAGVSVAFISLGEDGNMTVQKQSDGTYTVLLDGQVGVTAALSAGEAYGKVEVGDYGGSVGAEAEINGGVFAGAGVEFSFPDKKSADEFTDWVGRQVAKQGAKSIGGALNPVGGPAIGIGVDVGSWLWDKVTGYDYKPPAPTASFFEGGISAGGSASAGGLTAGGSAELNQENALGIKLDHETGDRTVYTRVELTAEAAAQLGFSSSDGNWGTGASGNGTVEMVVATTVDSDMNLKSVSLDGAATADGSYALTSLGGFPLQGSGGKGVQFSAQFDVTDGNRSQVVQALAGLGALTTVAGPGVSQAAAIPMIIAEAQRNGDVTAQFLDVSSSNILDVAVGAEAPVIGGLGVNFGASTSSSSSTDAYYLGDHGWEDWTACAS